MPRSSRERTRAHISNRRHFLAGGAGLTGAWIAARAGSLPDASDAWHRTWNAAAAVLAGNLHQIPRYAGTVLFEGSSYQGIWLECAPHEGLVYAAP